jgi:hypothetical protein
MSRFGLAAIAPKLCASRSRRRCTCPQAQGSFDRDRRSRPSLKRRRGDDRRTQAGRSAHRFSRTARSDGGNLRARSTRGCHQSGRSRLPRTDPGRRHRPALDIKPRTVPAEPLAVSNPLYCLAFFEIKNHTGITVGRVGKLPSPSDRMPQCI